jgi:large conductance mechanosensitive channel
MSSTDQPRHDFREDFGRVGHYAKDTLSGFRTFILRGNVVDLAVGIVIGAAFTSVVNGLVNDIITPLIPVSNKNSLADWTVGIPNTYIQNIHIGAFINAIISFLIVAAVLYFFIVRPVGALMARYNPAPKTPPETRDCPYCLQSIPLKATRCAFCTSPLPPIDENVGAPVPSQARHQG